MSRRFVALGGPQELRATLAPLARGPYDPTMRLGRAEVWRATRTPEGDGTARYTVVDAGVETEAFGPGAPWLLEHAPDLVGALDDGRAFAPTLEPFRSLVRRHPHLRLTTAGNPVELLVPTILEQKVTSIEAHRAYSRLVRAHGEPAPGPCYGLRLPPAPERLAELSFADWHVVGVERRRAQTVREVCRRAAAIERVALRGSAEFQTRITSLPGIGPWTATGVACLAFGDADAVLLGDFHIPSFVAWNLVGERAADDARMLELLEPVRPHRARAVALLGREGSSPPRRGPKLALRDIRAI
ncbi:MAG: DNA-3-methyladenine glycosylase family protein [Acidimicrobiia bacterium]